MAGLIVAVINYVQRDIRFATTLLVLLGLLARVHVWWTRPDRAGEHISHIAAHATADDGDVIVYYRLGCIHCDRLKLGLGRARRDVFWVNIQADPKAATFVATLHDGNKTVPTALTGAGEIISATPASIKAHLRSSAARQHSSVNPPESSRACDASKPAGLRPPGNARLQART